MKGKHSFLGGLFSRIFWCLVTIVGAGAVLVVGYNIDYDHATPHRQRELDQDRTWLVQHIPDYHPRKNTKYTRKAQNGEAKFKQKVQNRDDDRK